MGKNIIVSEETVRDLLEAHASLSAWYYELWAALRSGNPSPRTPDDAARSAFVEPLAAVFPEIASVARSIKVPRMFVPSPPTYTTSGPAAESTASAQTPPTNDRPEAEVIAAPAEPPAAPPKEPAEAQQPAAAAGPAVAPPPLVIPSQVKYNP